MAILPSMSGLTSLSIEATWTQECFVEGVWTVCGSDNNDSFLAVGIHGDQSWFNVCSRSSFPFRFRVERVFPMASSSSIKMMQEFFLACANGSRTLQRLHPHKFPQSLTPMCERREHQLLPQRSCKKGFPVPGGPTNKTPLGMRPRGEETMVLQDRDKLFNPRQLRLHQQHHQIARRVFW